MSTRVLRRRVGAVFFNAGVWAFSRRWAVEEFNGRTWVRLPETFGTWSEAEAVRRKLDGVAS